MHTAPHTARLPPRRSADPDSRPLPSEAVPPPRCLSLSQESKIPVSVADLNNVFRQVDRGGPAGKHADKELTISEFVEALVRLAVQVGLVCT